MMIPGHTCWSTNLAIKILWWKFHFAFSWPLDTKNANSLVRCLWSFSITHHSGLQLHFFSHSFIRIILLMVLWQSHISSNFQTGNTSGPISFLFVIWLTAGHDPQAACLSKSLPDSPSAASFPSGSRDYLLFLSGHLLYCITVFCLHSHNHNQASNPSLALLTSVPLYCFSFLHSTYHCYYFS